MEDNIKMFPVNRLCSFI